MLHVHNVQKVEFAHLEGQNANLDLILTLSNGTTVALQLYRAEGLEIDLIKRAGACLKRSPLPLVIGMISTSFHGVKELSIDSDRKRWRIEVKCKNGTQHVLAYK